MASIFHNRCTGDATKIQGNTTEEMDLRINSTYQDDRKIYIVTSKLRFYRVDEPVYIRCATENSLSTHSKTISLVPHSEFCISRTLCICVHACMYAQQMWELEIRNGNVECHLAGKGINAFLSSKFEKSPFSKEGDRTCGKWNRRSETIVGAMRNEEMS